jgi:hypothetical protein
VNSFQTTGSHVPYESCVTGARDLQATVLEAYCTSCYLKVKNPLRISPDATHYATI